MPFTEAETVLCDGLQPCVLLVAVKSPFLPAKACGWARNSTRIELKVGLSSVSIKGQVQAIYWTTSLCYRSCLGLGRILALVLGRSTSRG
jgi:hypothetical protein